MMGRQGGRHMQLLVTFRKWQDTVNWKRKH